MKSQNSSIVLIQSAQKSLPLSKAQKQFNSLSRKIEKLKHRLTEWQEDFPQFHQKVGSEYSALHEKYNERRIELVQLFDRAHHHKMFTRRDKKKLKRIILDIVDELMLDKPSKEIRELHDKYSDIDYDVKNAISTESMKSAMEEMFGLDIGDDIDLNSPDDFFAHFADIIREQGHSQAKTKEKEKDRRSGKKSKQTAQQAAKEERLQEEKRGMRKSLQDVYRKLAATLHPDRELDAKERERKTQLMQQTNVAYKNQDLLRLLELQLEIEQIDRSHINAISEKHLLHYNKILKEQVKELELAIQELIFSFGPEFAYSELGMMTPKQVIARMKRDLKDLKQSAKEIQVDIREFSNFSNLKSWLRVYEIPVELNMDELFDSVMEEAFFDFQDEVVFNPTKPKSKSKTRK